MTLSSNSPGSRLFMLGNEAIARGAIEAGVQVVGAYPGTPSTEIAETLMRIGPEFGIYSEWSVNEKVAFGVAFGASICGLRSLAVMKHVGVNVALDSLMTAGYFGVRGGLVLVEAEDPGQWSSQSEQDNRFLAEMGYLPMLEPSSAQEAKDMLVEAFKLSEEFGHPFILRTTTRIGHAREDVALGEISGVKRSGVFRKDPAQFMSLPAITRQHRRLMVGRLEKIKAAVDSLSYNRVQTIPGAALGIITSGICYSYVVESLRWLGITDKVSLLKIGTPYPLPEKTITAFVRSVPGVLVVEELEPFLENHIKVIAREAGLPAAIHGKDVIPLIGELSIRKVTEAVSRIAGAALPLDFSAIDRRVKEVETLLPSRPPTLCAGCPHRASHFAISIACERYEKRTGIKPVRPGDIGCNALGSDSPLNAVDLSTCMGGGFDLSNGIARSLNVPVVAHMGDSTFFHSGIPPLVNAVYNKTRLTMIVLDNQTIAMTGSQPSPASGEDAVRPERIAKASGVKFVRVVDPLDLEKSIRTVERAIAYPGTSFIVFRKQCSILEQREKRSRGEKVVPYRVEKSKCLADSPPPCTAACPLHIDVRGYIGLVKAGKYDAALALVRQKLPFPGIMGRICTHPCEANCRREEVDESMAIAALKRSASDFGKTSWEEIVPALEKKGIAVVGGGPAGLMAAYDLRRLGYPVTIFESASSLGGMLTSAIPEYRLPRSISQPEIDAVRKMGTEVRLNTRVGRDISLAELRRQFAAVFIATGAPEGKGLNLPQGRIKNIISGIDFLRSPDKGEGTLSQNVAIIGGGNVAVDCARTCLRRGYRKVTIIYRRTLSEMPAIAQEIAEAQKEGVKFVFLASPVRVLTGDGKLAGLECIRMRLSGKDASGRKQPVPLKGSEFELKTDLVIAAVGEQPDLEFINQKVPSLSVRDGLLQVDHSTLFTGVPGIFAGGDVVTGPAAVIDALAAGRKAAVSIDRYLKNQPLDGQEDTACPRLERVLPQICGINLPLGSTPSKKTRTSSLLTSISARQNSFAEVEKGFTRSQAEEEASRCLACECRICITSLGCPAIVDVDGEITIDSGQCSGCGLCAQICPSQAIVREM